MAYNAFKDLTGDNELVMRLLDHKHIKSALIRDFGGSEDCILCDKEVAKLIQLPQITLIDIRIASKQEKFNCRPKL